MKDVVELCDGGIVLLYRNLPSPLIESNSSFLPSSSPEPNLRFDPGLRIYLSSLFELCAADGIV